MKADYWKGFIIGIISCIPLVLLTGWWFTPLVIGFGMAHLLAMNEPQKWKDWIFWNMILYVFCVVVMFLAVQHSTFIYDFPPNLNEMSDVSTTLYFILGLAGYILLKIGHMILTLSRRN